MSHNNAHDFFKKFNTLFEGKEEDVKAKADKDSDNYSKGKVRANFGDKAEQGPGSSAEKKKAEKKEVKENSFQRGQKADDEFVNDKVSKNRADKRAADDEAWAKSKGTPKKEVKEGWSDENPDLDKGEEMEKAQCKADDERKAKKENAACDAMDKKDKKASNVKETASEFYRRYADIVNEAFGDDDEEDPDVAAADKVKGKDGATQSDAEKKLPPWLQKKDKEDEDKGAATTKKEKMESIQKEIQHLEYLKAAKAINEAVDKK